jgi:hypothetical protein
VAGRPAIVLTISKGPPGRALAEQLAREPPLLTFRMRRRAFDPLAATRQSGRRSTCGETAGVLRFVDLEQRFGRLDICVTNTGGLPSKLFGATLHADGRTWTDQLQVLSQKQQSGRSITIPWYSAKAVGLQFCDSQRAAVAALPPSEHTSNVNGARSTWMAGRRRVIGRLNGFKPQSAFSGMQT